jgi:hypothetical protein
VSLVEALGQSWKFALEWFHAALVCVALAAVSSRLVPRSRQREEADSVSSHRRNEVDDTEPLRPKKIRLLTSAATSCKVRCYAATQFRIRLMPSRIRAKTKTKRNNHTKG